MKENRNTPAQSREADAHSAKGRPDRVRFGSQNKLAIANQFVRDGYHAHLFVDKEGEIEAAQAAYYEFVRDEKGRKVTMAAGGGRTHYLMEIEQKYYDEDMKAQADAIDKKMMTTNSLKDNEYSPEGHNVIATRDREQI